MRQITRTLFYNIEPLDNDGFIESFTSYISRLAKTHKISSQNIFDVIVNELGEENEYKARREYSSILYLLNGMGKFSQNWGAALSKLTGQKTLSHISLVNWRNVIRPLVQLRKYKAWCPICFQEWKDKSQEIYEPLLWSLSQNKICPKHLVYLVSTCPNPLCNRLIPTLGSQTTPGYCSYCGSWLGSKCLKSLYIYDEDLWISNSLHTLLLCNRDISAATSIIGNKIAMNLFNPLGSIHNENSGFLASIFGVHETTINRWKRGESPSLLVLLNGCYLLQRSPFLLNNDPINIKKVTQFVRNQVRKNPFEQRLIEMYENNQMTFHKEFDSLIFSSKSIGDFCRRINVRELVLDFFNPKLYSYLKTSIKQERSIVIKTISNNIMSFKNSEETHSLQDVAEKLSIPLRTLRKITPELCKSISQHRIYMKKEASKQKSNEMNNKVYSGTIDYLRQGIYPSQMQISKLLPHRAYLLNIEIRNSIKKAKMTFELQYQEKF